MTEIPILKYEGCTAPTAPFELIFHKVEGREVQMHQHDFCELLWMESGGCLHPCNGQEMRLGCNDLLLLRALDAHAFHQLPEGVFHCVNLAFREPVLLSFIERYRLDDRFWNREPGTAMQPERLTPDAGTRLRQAFLQLRNSRGTVADLDHFLLHLALEVLPAAQEPFAACPAWLRECCMQMQNTENLRQGPRRFAELSQRRLEHIARVLRQTTGKTPVEWVTVWRMAHARKQLAESSIEIADLAWECGYSSLGQFYQVFTRHTGMPPRRYRLRQQHLFPTANESLS